MNIDLSVIIPVYNAESYIEELLNSIIKQMKSNIELIIIDDGSIDNSKKKISDLTEGIPNITCFSQANTGVAGARNKGLELSKGRYLWFCDSDDKVLDGAIECITNVLYENHDIYLFIHNESCDFDTSRQIKWYGDIEHDFVCDERILKKFFFDSKFAMVLWDKVIKRELIMENNIQFELSTLEDYYFLFKCFIKLETCKYVPKSIYEYKIMHESYSKKYRSDYYKNLIIV